MNYTKSPLTIDQQIIKLEQRGLNFLHKEQAEHYLNNISYYRLRAYTYPFQDNDIPENDHVFLQKEIDFSDIIDLYVFDRQLRNLIFNELAKIEVAVRTQLSLVYSIHDEDAFWYTNGKNYKKSPEKLLSEITSDVDQSNEDFIKHFKTKYSSTLMPPSWMALEVISFGTLSRLYKQLGNTAQKRKIARSFGIGDEEVFANWLHAFSNLRNCCAHHSRIWNRRFVVQLKLPYNTTFPFIPRNSLALLKQNKLFVLLSAIKYVTDAISPGNSFRIDLAMLLNGEHKLLNLKDMGFPNNWEEFPIWNR